MTVLSSRLRLAFLGELLCALNLAFLARRPHPTPSSPPQYAVPGREETGLLGYDRVLMSVRDALKRAPAQTFADVSISYRANSSIF